MFGPSTALTLHRSVIHYRLARLRYVLDYPNYIRRKDDTDQVTDNRYQKKILRRFAPQYDIGFVILSEESFQVADYRLQTTAYRRQIILISSPL